MRNSRKRRALCVFYTSLALASSASARTADSLQAAPAEPRPFEFSWPRETALLASGLTGHFIGHYRLTHMDPVRPSETRRADIPAWERWAAGNYSPAADLASDGLSMIIGPAMVYADAWHAWRGEGTWRPFGEDFLILAQAASWNSALNLNIRAERVHPRPLVYGTKAPASERSKPEAAGSFYSGHASGAFLGAVYVATVYPLRHPEFEHRGWLWAGSLALATTVSALRVPAGKHFPSDLIAGAAMGSLIGLGFAQLHRPAGMELWGVELWPVLDAAGAPGLTAVRRF
jgi:membrane-associated phospholipid phosphatase